MKVTGSPRIDGGKDYIINHEGNDYLAAKTGSLFCCNGVTGTLKELKTRVLLGTMPETKEEESNCRKQGLWDHVDPCALLVLTIGDQKAHKYQAEIMRTLDANGYLTEKGAPDYRRAMHNLKVVTGERQ